jgi:hypothetical protein
MNVTRPITTPFTAQTTAADVVAGSDLGGSRVIVTGGASGIGLETTRALAGQRVASDIVAATGNTHVLVAIEGLCAIWAVGCGRSGPKSSRYRRGLPDPKDT